MPGSLLPQIPPELVHPILQYAAHAAIETDRAWVVDLALVARFVYELVQPVLYHTMVVTETNQLKFRELARDDASAHVFQAVRRLVTDGALRHWDAGDLQRLFTGVTSIDAPLGLVEKLSASPAFRPRILAVRYCWFARCADELPRATLASVTHLTGFFPSGSQTDSALTEEPVAQILDAMPALAHLGLDVLYLNKTRDEDKEITLAPLDLVALERALRAALRHERLRVVAMHVGGDWSGYWNDVVRIAMRLRDARVFAWHDTRPMRSWARQSEYAASDGLAGRSVWSEARQLWRPAP